MSHDCQRILDSAVRALREGREVTADDAAHLGSCLECRRVFAGLRALEEELDQAPAAPLAGTRVEAMIDETAGLTAATARRRRWRAGILGGTLAALAALVIYFVNARELTLPLPLVAMIVVGPPVLVGILFAALHALFRSRQRPLYRRLGPGRQLQGVCIGLSEATGAPALVFRLAFLALFFVNGSGFWLYLLFAIMMQVHPEDRRYLLSFRLARAWRARFS